MTGGLAIFVKTPGLSPLKTRLAQGVGQLRAEVFYVASAEAVASVALQAQEHDGPTAYWAVAEPAAMTYDAWLDLPRIPQGGGTLGERMDHVYRQLLERHRFALLIGADTPQIVSESLLRASNWLSSDEPRLVIGHAVDGGFWLFGGNTDLPRPAWSVPTYSSAHTAADFMRVMHPMGRWLEVESMADVDHVQDLPRVLHELDSLPQPTPAQQRLAQWLEDSRIAMAIQG